MSDLKPFRSQINAIAKKHGAKNLRVFGSVARGEGNSESDLDLLISLEPGYTLLNAGGFLMDLQELLGTKVDVVTEGGLHRLIKDEILQEAVEL